MIESERKVIKLLLWLCLLLTTECLAKERLNKRDSAQDRIHIQNAQPYVKEEPGFFSRIASWIFPFGGGSQKTEIDLTSSSNHLSASYLPPPNKAPPKYLPPENLSPPHSPRNIPIAQEPSDCNPCNREPWIPIPGKSGRNTVINFVPPHHDNSGGLDGLNPPPQQYGPPNGANLENSHLNHINAITTFDRPPTVHQELPNPQYGPPAGHQEILKPQYGPPNTNLPSPQYGVPNIEITPSVLVGSLVTPKTSGFSFNQYVPAIRHGNNAPETPSTYPQVPKTYGPPSIQFRTKLTPVSSIRHHMIPPPLKTVHHTSYVNIVGMRPPPPPSGSFTTHLVPVQQHHKNPNSIQDILQPPVSQHSVLNEEFPPYTSKPVEAYGTPNIHGIEQIPLSSGDNDEFGYPIAFPNLSIRPLVPLHNHIQFKKGHASAEKVESIQILQSVPIADYVSSIEHPINVIQSPIVDLSVPQSSETTKLININNHPEFTSHHSNPKTNTIQSGIFVNPNINTGKLNENPIIVDDAQTAASSRNETYQKSDQSSKRDNNNDIGVYSFESTTTIPASGREEIEEANSIGEDIRNEIHIGFDKKNASKELKFTETPLDYSQWTPTWSGVSVDMTPPSVQSSWTTSFDTTETPTKKGKHIQIIIPYYNFNSSKNFFNKNSYPVVQNKKEFYTTLLPVYTPPPVTEQSLWSHFLEDYNTVPNHKAQGAPFRKPTSIRAHNIQDLLTGVTQSKTQDLPFDILTFQKNIDEWTHLAYAKTTEKLSSHEGVIQKLNPSKRIPDQYLTTVPYDYTTTQPLSNFLTDQEPAGSVRKENFQDDIGNSLTFNDVSTTEEISTEHSTTEVNTEKDIGTTLEGQKEKKSLWQETEITVSSDNKEKVYIVTPATTVAWSAAPKIAKESTTENTLLFDHPKFSIRIQKNNSDSDLNGNGTTKVIFSEWPHKINNLQTTTVKTTSRHPLFGLMDVSAYNPPKNKVIANVNGHSRILQDLASFVEEQSKINKQSDK